MRSSRFKLLLGAVFLGGILLSSQAFAAEEGPGTQWAGDLGTIKARLETLESQQREILAKEDKILAELDRIRIWVRRQ